MGLDFDRANAAVQQDRGPASPQLAEMAREYMNLPGVQRAAVGSSVLLTGIDANYYSPECALAGVSKVENRIHIQKGGPVVTTRDPADADEPSARRY